jgi:hypothetical protein
VEPFQLGNIPLRCGTNSLKKCQTQNNGSAPVLSAPSHSSLSSSPHGRRALDMAAGPHRSAPVHALAPPFAHYLQFALPHHPCSNAAIRYPSTSSLDPASSFASFQAPAPQRLLPTSMPPPYAHLGSTPPPYEMFFASFCPGPYTQLSLFWFNDFFLHKSRSIGVFCTGK